MVPDKPKLCYIFVHLKLFIGILRYIRIQKLQKHVRNVYCKFSTQQAAAGRLLSDAPGDHFLKDYIYFVSLIRWNEVLGKMWRRSRMSNSIAGSKFFKNFFCSKLNFHMFEPFKWFRGLLNGAWRHILCSEIRLKNSECLYKSQYPEFSLIFISQRLLCRLLMLPNLLINEKGSY